MQKPGEGQTFAFTAVFFTLCFNLSVASAKGSWALSLDQRCDQYITIKDKTDILSTKRHIFTCLITMRSVEQHYPSYVAIGT